MGAFSLFVLVVASGSLLGSAVGRYGKSLRYRPYFALGGAGLATLPLMLTLQGAGLISFDTAITVGAIVIGASCYCVGVASQRALRLDERSKQRDSANIDARHSDGAWLKRLSRKRVDD